MEMIIVILIVAAVLLYFIRSFAKKLKGNNSCGCGCSCGFADTECEIREKERTWGAGGPRPFMHTFHDIE